MFKDPYRTTVDKTGRVWGQRHDRQGKPVGRAVLVSNPHFTHVNWGEEGDLTPAEREQIESFMRGMTYLAVASVIVLVALVVGLILSA